MEAKYSVGVTNRYALFLGEEDDPGDNILPSSNRPEKPESKDSKKKEKVVKVKSKEVKERGQQKVTVDGGNIKPSDRPPTKNDRPRSERPPRGEGRRPLGSTGERGEREDRSSWRGRGGGRTGGRPRLSSREKENEGGLGEREKRGRGPRLPGRGGGERPPFRGKREFERRSGSDKSSVKAFEKREGGGAHNWGKPNELEAGDEWPNDEGEAPSEQQERPKQSEHTTNGDTSGAGEAAEEHEEKPEGEGEEEDEGEGPPAEEEPREMTLDEYKAMQAEPTVKPEVERRAGENVDLSQWKDTVRYAKQDEEYFPGTREVIEKPKTSGRVKHTVDANFFFRDPARRGGRGRGGGRNTRGGFEGERLPRGSFDKDRERDRPPRGNFDKDRDRERPPREGFDGDRPPRGGDRDRTSRGGFDRERPRGGFDRNRPPRGNVEGGRRFRDKHERAPNVEDETEFPAISAPPLNSPP